MCLEIFYQYSCGHIIGARSDQIAWQHCDLWAPGQSEDSCPNFDAAEIHETHHQPSTCQECAYITPPASDASDQSASSSEESDQSESDQSQQSGPEEGGDAGDEDNPA
jgi:hypothetical protein